MANVFDYLDWRGDISFEGAPFCEVDALILAEISYVPFEKIKLGRGITLKMAAEEFFKENKSDSGLLGLILPSEILPLLERISKTERFGDVILRDYVSVTDKDVGEQFSACTFDFGKRRIYIAFRGTDDSVVGWEEDFNMAFKCPVPAQRSSVEYVNKASRGARQIIVGGHSKGGNLAIYGSSLSLPAVKQKIERVYNFDGPGFIHGFFSSKDYLEIESRVCTVVPESSIVGMLLDHGEKYKIVSSTAHGIWQHDAFSWEVLGSSFTEAGKMTKETLELNRAFSEWLGGLSEDERHEIVSAFFSVLHSTEASTLTDLAGNKKIGKAILSLEKEKRKILFEKLGGFLSGNASALFSTFVKPTIIEKGGELVDAIKAIKRKNDKNADH